MDSPNKHGCVVAVKGLGRISILLWALYFSYQHQRVQIEESENIRNDFRRLPGIPGRESRKYLKNIIGNKRVAFF